VAGNYSEGATKTITVNAYERDPTARRACIEYHGAICQCCGFDFEKTWASTAEDLFTFIISGR
jgi:5-methylcytosine-specific restriction protein A